MASTLGPVGAAGCHPDGTTDEPEEMVLPALMFASQAGYTTWTCVLSMMAATMKKKPSGMNRGWPVAIQLVSATSTVTGVVLSAGGTTKSLSVTVKALTPSVPGCPSAPSLPGIPGMLIVSVSGQHAGWQQSTKPIDINFRFLLRVPESSSKRLDSASDV